MSGFIKQHTWLLILLGIIVSGCRPTKIATSEKTEGLEWDVVVRRAGNFYDPSTGVDTDAKYTVADTAFVNQKLLGIKPENLTLEWTIPSANGRIWLVAYENGPILSEKVIVTEANSFSNHDGNIQVAFKFPDVQKWAEITRENIGKRLAIFVNGQLMNAPQVNSEITSGNCSVSIPADKIQQYLPNL